MNNGNYWKVMKTGQKVHKIKKKLSSVYEGKVCVLFCIVSCFMMNDHFVKRF